VKIAHIIIEATPGEDKIKETEKILEEIMLNLSEGDKFEDLAKKYSDDLSTRDRGGDIGFLERGDMLPQVERRVFILNPGEVSNPIKTELGYFIVKLEEMRLGKVHLKHILINLAPTEEDEVRAEQLALELVERLRGGEDFAAIAAEYSADEDTKTEGGLLGEFTSGDLPERYEDQVAALEEGGVSDPVNTSDGWEIIKVLEKNPPRPFDLEDVEQNIRQGLAQEKSFDEFIEKMKAKTYIEIRL
jgi:parvulin-like peptidyl-prolyl isomerase